MFRLSSFFFVIVLHGVAVAQCCGDVEKPEIASDPRLLVPITHNSRAPKASELREFLEKKTGVPLTMSGHSDQTPGYGSLSYRNVPA